MPQVVVAGYVIIGLSLFVFVQARNVYPQLLLARLFFSVGGAATYVVSQQRAFRICANLTSLSARLWSQLSYRQ